MARPPYVSFHIRAARPGRPAAADIVASVQHEVRAGLLPVGSRLPPVRVLEQQLGMSKNTVQSAYDELVSRGVLETREREGVFVVAGAIDSVAGENESRAPGNPEPFGPRAPLPRLRPPTPLRAATAPRGKQTHDVIELSTVFLDPDLLPRERLADCVRSVVRLPGLATFHDVQGYPPLRELVAARLRARGMDVTAESVIVTTGSQQAIDIVARAVEVRRVAVESPVYPNARALFETLGLSITALPLDPFAGIPTEIWEERLVRNRPGFVYAITSYQNPTGYSYTTRELSWLLEVSARYDIPLVEDDWGSDMLSNTEYRPTLRAMGGPGVVYINSFTKKLLPSLRVGFVVADPALVPSLVAMKRLSTLGNAWLTEATVAEFLDRGHYDTHLALVQRELDARYHACLRSLERTMPEGVSWTLPGGGPTLWLEIPRSVSLTELEATMQTRGVSIQPIPAAFTGEPHLHGFQIGYAFSPPDRLAEGLARLGEALRR